ncbi:succinate dehydrogenase cytochrome b subunit SDH3 KNAG_0A06120 [Huiozyma naganishii CBS 8797]|uniref:Uncharacterized protein n=1 Tax=Huiozyma naganishii (strain ATCC MYA-139 / BCRC 22969 / CBS 8797 / KCTC 17520 / NBRC 10181 / NCYC 3082 / Yp74L-3) TaxID=1071383 RepID=J7S2N4_HUIN7|nr:hypothetical protein KNAG_0A06120 [Kazachstania naganishii CBS 8797]CCK68274.1 hypothetical protein KNAG_0A06120 [Kazachstania naganishii CBS 8797]
MLKVGLRSVARPCLRGGNVVNRAVPRALTLVSMQHRRLASSYVETDRGEGRLLIEQRKARPISPHLTIYQPQLTWYLSSVHRVSLVFMGFAFYLVTILFGVSGLLGLNVTTEKLTKWYHDRVSAVSQWTVKVGAAYLFALHYGGAIRHMFWDLAKELTLKGVYRTGYAVLGFAAVAGTYLLTL